MNDSPSEVFVFRRSFASRLDRRRTVILASVRFHRMTQYIGERCQVLNRPGRWSPDATDVVMLRATLKELTSRREALGQRNCNHLYILYAGVKNKIQIYNTFRRVL